MCVCVSVCRSLHRWLSGDEPVPVMPTPAPESPSSTGGLDAFVVVEAGAEAAGGAPAELVALADAAIAAATPFVSVTMGVGVEAGSDMSPAVVDSVVLFEMFVVIKLSVILYSAQRKVV